MKIDLENQNFTLLEFQILKKSKEFFICLWMMSLLTNKLKMQNSNAEKIQMVKGAKKLAASGAQYDTFGVPDCISILLSVCFYLMIMQMMFEQSLNSASSLKSLAQPPQPHQPTPGLPRLTYHLHRQQRNSQAPTVI